MKFVRYLVEIGVRNGQENAMGKKILFSLSRLNARKEYRPLMAKPVIEPGKLTTRFVVEAKSLPAIGISLQRLHSAYGTVGVHALEVTAWGEVPSLPESQKIYTLDIRKPVTFDYALDAFSKNSSALVKGWMMTGAERIVSEKGSWNSEISFTPDKLSINGVVSRHSDQLKSIKMVRSTVLPRMMSAKFDSLSAQWGMYLRAPLPGTIEFATTSVAYRPQGELCTLTNTGFISAVEVNKYLADLFMKQAVNVEEVLLYGSLIHGFNRGISIRERVGNDGYIMTVEIDSLSGELKDRVHEGYLKALSGA